MHAHANMKITWLVDRLRMLVNWRNQDQLVSQTMQLRRLSCPKRRSSSSLLILPNGAKILRYNLTTAIDFIDNLNIIDVGDIENEDVVVRGLVKESRRQLYQVIRFDTRIFLIVSLQIGNQHLSDRVYFYLLKCIQVD